jgi:hypothetical protein
MSASDALLTRLTDLIGQGDHLRHGDSHDQARNEAHRSECVGWLAAALNVVEGLCPDGTSYRRAIATSIDAGFTAGYGVCRRVAEVVEQLKNLHADGIVTLSK